MSDIRITPLAPGEFGVEVIEGNLTTGHRVRVPENLADQLGLFDVDPEALVEESFGFLLEREPATSIMPDFSLDTISRFFPEYPDELRRRLGAS